MIPFSILDLSLIGEGYSVSQALDQSRRLAIKAEQHGYNRLWLAEHHGMPGIASAATALVIAHVGAATKTIRVGSGGIMLPNHSPLVIAEQFGTLEALLPGRVDLGLGRAPGTDMRTANALRRNLDAGAENFPQDIVELKHLLGTPVPNQAILAVPGTEANVPIWLLGSSTYSAHVAAALGLPYAFASHFAPDMLLDAIAIYRDRFQPSADLDKPYVMAGVMGVAADTDEEANRLFTSSQQQFVNLRKNVRGLFPKPLDTMDGFWTPMEKMNVEHTLRYAAVGSPRTIERKLGEFLAETQADELIISMPIHDIDKRLRSVELFSQLSLMDSQLQRAA
ncbi:alkane 1-monooxygenase [Rhizobium sp. Leaf306]|uniref:LLM class flavin-dependent oxidoreductase n=1 Tax=Rhizobium/Agrobacterium group TaxID=227290 RepID=UPI000712B636|nr:MULTISPECIES: LLM class flavin-dependent oxidoreductase [unclassified Rhizobium]KQQ34704.1 alkane 1-monooxygenase [Rhizobium sp. Leaf306]MBD8651553.1 LLM class flavin-dependent oxidoreductase [Rhizobium sp. CFBP 13726]MBD8662248.1 LLM class flavin-dependent oxidoreductase [Rhizobium sp. CFBP 8752]RYE67797.1 MAG: LLM class flavin-dependent oxidoreductase [Rhizobiaceae bacterium]